MGEVDSVGEGGDVRQWGCDMQALPEWKLREK